MLLSVFWDGDADEDAALEVVLRSFGRLDGTDAEDVCNPVLPADWADDGVLSTEESADPPVCVGALADDGAEENMLELLKLVALLCVTDVILSVVCELRLADAEESTLSLREAETEDEERALELDSD